MSTATQELIIAWLVFPALLIAVSVYLGLAVFRFSHLGLKNPFVLPTGFAALIVVGQIATMNSKVASKSPLVFSVITLMCALYFGTDFFAWLKENLKALALGGLVFYMHGLPILMTKTPTFAGWIKLDDGSSWLAITDQMLLAGRDNSILNPSSHEAIVQILLNPPQGNIPYPAGSFVPLGIFSKWLFIDPAWTIQPYMAAAAMLLSITFLALLMPIKIPIWSKFSAAFIAPTSALFYAYEMWGGIKELLLVPLLVLIVALIPLVLSRPNEPRRVIPFAIACSSYVLIFSLSGLVWLSMPILLLVVKLTRKTKHLPWKHALLFTGTFLVSSLAAFAPLVNSPKGLLKLLSFAQSSSDIGNLLGPLKFEQIFGIWLTGDFRYTPEFPFINTTLVILTGTLFVLGCYFLMTSGHSHIGALGIWVTLLSAFALKGNAWISGKTLAMASPIVLVIAFCAIGYLANRFNLEATVLAFALSSGVIVSFLYTYHEAWLAPYAQLKELEVIGENTSYSAPALMVESNPYGGRHFLRKLDPEVPGLLRRNLIPLKNGKGLANGGFADIDEFSLDAIQNYKTLVLRTSATSSRPPSNYDLKFSGTYYEVWQKNISAKVPIQHYSFGNKVATTGIAECTLVESEIAPLSASNEVLISVGKNTIQLPITKVADKNQEPTNELVFESKFDLANSSTFDLWVEGFTKGSAELFIDGIPVAEASHVLNQGGNMTKIGNVQLTSGPHALKVLTSSPWIMPGSGGLSYSMGPFYLSDQNQKYSVTTVEPSELNTLCTKPVDWIELVPR